MYSSCLRAICSRFVGTWLVTFTYVSSRGFCLYALDLIRVQFVFCLGCIEFSSPIFRLGVFIRIFCVLFVFSSRFFVCLFAFVTSALPFRGIRSCSQRTCSCVLRVLEVTSSSIFPFRLLPARASTFTSSFTPSGYPSLLCVVIPLILQTCSRVLRYLTIVLRQHCLSCSHLCGSPSCWATPVFVFQQSVVTAWTPSPLVDFSIVEQLLWWRFFSHLSTIRGA